VSLILPANCINHGQISGCESSQIEHDPRNELPTFRSSSVSAAGDIQLLAHRR
jgi:hypothetical protein